MFRAEREAAVVVSLRRVVLCLLLFFFCAAIGAPFSLFPYRRIQRVNHIFLTAHFYHFQFPSTPHARAYPPQTEGKREADADPFQVIVRRSLRVLIPPSARRLFFVLCLWCAETCAIWRVRQKASFGLVYFLVVVRFSLR